jgi:hypothetical protein
VKVQDADREPSHRSPYTHHHRPRAPPDRRKTKSKILRKARVISYEDIEVARAKRAKQEINKEAKGKRKPGRPKRVASEAEAIANKGKVHRNLIEPQWHAYGSGGLKMTCLGSHMLQPM